MGASETQYNFVALVPMRHHSERVEGKNYRPFAGRPLYTYILETLTECPEISRIVVDTDSPVIMGGVAAEFPNVTLIERPVELRGDFVSMNKVLEHDVTIVPARYYVQTHSTNPLLRSETISAAIQQFLASFPDHDSVFSTTPIQTRLWDGDCRPLNHNFGELIRTQDLEPWYEENSCIYLFERSRFLSAGHRIGEAPSMFVMDPIEAWDIDEESDFITGEYLLGAMNSGGIFS